MSNAIRSVAQRLRIAGAVRWKAARCRLRSVQESPHRLALGIAIGLFVGLLPLVGLQTGLVIALAWMFSANKAIGLPIVWISNPATFVPIFYPCYRVGAWLLGQSPVDFAWWQRLADPPVGRSLCAFYWQSIFEVSGPLMVGSLLLASLVAGAGYWVALRGISRLRGPWSSARSN